MSKKIPPTESKPIQPPAMDPESREKQLMALAYNEAERQIKEGKASSAVLCHFLKLATKKEQLMREIMTEQKILIQAKANSIEKDRESGELAKAAIDAMKKYRPSDES